MNNSVKKILSAVAGLSIGAAVLSGCSGFQVPEGLTAAATTSVSQTETTAESTAAASSKPSATDASEQQKQTEASFTADTVNAKIKSLEGTAYAAGTTYLGESENQAALEVVLTELGVDEKVYAADPSRLIDCGGSDIWFICFSDDVTSVKVVLGDEEDGKELYKAENPGYIFIRCYSSGEVPSCTVIISGRKTGYTVFFPYIIGGDIVLPNGGTVMNQTEGMDSYIDIPDETDNSDETEEEEP